MSKIKTIEEAKRHIKYRIEDAVKNMVGANKEAIENYLKLAFKDSRPAICADIYYSYVAVTVKVFDSDVRDILFVQTSISRSLIKIP